MKVLFKEIRAGDIDAVRSRLDASPALVASTATAPPKKDDGQSPLQVAIKSGRFEIAHLLIDRGADIDFMEAPARSGWRTPLLHDAIRATVFRARYTRIWAAPGEPPIDSEDEFNRAFDVLERLLESGADVNRLDSAGNPALLRAILDARQVCSDPPVPDMIHDLRRVFDALLAAGAEPEWVDPRDKRSLTECVSGTVLRQFLP